MKTKKETHGTKRPQKISKNPKHHLKDQEDSQNIKTGFKKPATSMGFLADF